MSESQDQKIAELERELEAYQHMLYFVLSSLDEPVRVSKELMAQGIVEDTTLWMEEDDASNTFIFSVKPVSDEQ